MAIKIWGETTLETQEKQLPLLAEIVYDWWPRPVVAQEGWPRVLYTFGAASLLGLLAKLVGKNWVGRWLKLAAQLVAGYGLLTAYAYRESAREPLGRALDFLYAPVDGKLVIVEHTESEESFVKEPAIKMQFSSHPLDVPVVRAPCAGQVRFIYQQSGEPIKIGLEKVGGERILLEFETPLHGGLNLGGPLADSETLFLRMQVGESLTPSQTIAIRASGKSLLTTLYYPAATNTVLVRIGEPTCGGMTVLGRVNQKAK